MSQPIQPPADPAPRLRPRRTWRTLVGIAVVIALAVLVAFLLSRCAGQNGQVSGFGGGGSRGRTSITVGVATATLGDVPITVAALGTVTPEQTVSVISRVTGQIVRVGFAEGQMVRK